MTVNIGCPRDNLPWCVNNNFLFNLKLFSQTIAIVELIIVHKVLAFGLPFTFVCITSKEIPKLQKHCSRLVILILWLQLQLAPVFIPCYIPPVNGGCGKTSLQLVSARRQLDPYTRTS